MEMGLGFGLHGQVLGTKKTTSCSAGPSRMVIGSMADGGITVPTEMEMGLG
jgi:hypothetical protein